MSRRRCESYRATGRDEECSGLLSVRTVQIILSCLDLFFPVSNEGLSSKSCLVHQPDFLIRTQTWQFQLWKEISESLFCISLKSAALWAAAAKKKADTMHGVYERSLQNHKDNGQAE